MAKRHKTLLVFTGSVLSESFPQTKLGTELTPTSDLRSPKEQRGAAICRLRKRGERAMHCDICIQTVQILSILSIGYYLRLDKNISYCGPSATQLPLEVTGECPVVQ